MWIYKIAKSEWTFDDVLWVTTTFDPVTTPGVTARLDRPQLSHYGRYEQDAAGLHILTVEVGNESKFELDN